MSRWIGVDLDGTLAQYDHWRGERHIGDPVPRMMDRVRLWLKQGKEVRIFTERVAQMPDRDDVAEVTNIIQDWLEKHGLPRLAVTNVKDFEMIELWDDYRVQMNTGVVLGIS